jgi:meiotically up-regulated gene 157 (Mug157) protein
VPKTFVITGDIPAMWIRDSTSQMNPYLPFANKDLSLKRLILGVIHMQAQFLNIDSYANAFKMPADGTTTGIRIIERDDKVPLQVWEEKYEIDSLANFLRLSHSYWNTTGDASFVQDPVWMSAVHKVIRTIYEQQEPTYDKTGKTLKKKNWCEQNKNWIVVVIFTPCARVCSRISLQTNLQRFFTSSYSRRPDRLKLSFWTEEVTLRSEQD